jgi:hypothetical protein
LPPLQVIRQPDDALLAFLLGNAIGVMFLLSVAEMWVANAAANGWPEITVAFGLGALLYQLAQPFIPDFSSHVHDHSSVELDKVRGGQAPIAWQGALSSIADCGRWCCKWRSSQMRAAAGVLIGRLPPAPIMRPACCLLLLQMTSAEREDSRCIVPISPGRPDRQDSGSSSQPERRSVAARNGGGSNSSSAAGLTAGVASADLVADGAAGGRRAEAPRPSSSGGSGGSGGGGGANGGAGSSKAPQGLRPRQLLRLG